MGDVVGLAKSIDARGALLEPIVIDAKNNLIDGQRRMVAWPLTKLSNGGRLPIPVSIVDIDSIVAGEYDANTQRKDFTPSETVAIKRALEPAEKEAARTRQAHGSTGKGRKADKKTAEGRAADKVAKVVGRGRRTIEKAEAVVEAAERDPEKFGKLQADMDRTGRVDGPFKRLQVMTQGAELRKEPPPLPGQGPYRGVMIDFPWPAEQDDPDPVASGRAYYPYPTMSIEGIVAFAERARAILHDDAVVGVWITNFHLVNGHHVPVLAALGLKPVTMRTWVKDRFGQGHVMRGQTEHMIIGTRGSPTIDGASISTFFHAAAGKLHSQKPAKAYEDFERLVPAARYASLFHVGELPEKWDGHGDELAELASIGRESGDDQHASPAKRATWPDGHTITMTIDIVDEIGTCQCGAVFRVPRDGTTPEERLTRAAEMDALCEAHWRKVELEAGELQWDASATPATDVLPADTRPIYPKVFSAGDRVGPKALGVLRQKLQSGEIAFSDGNANIAWSADGTFRNDPALGLYDSEKKIKGGIRIRLRERKRDRDIEVDCYVDDRHTGFMGSTMPYGKVQKLLIAWGKTTTAPVDVATLPDEIQPADGDLAEAAE